MTAESLDGAAAQPRRAFPRGGGGPRVAFARAPMWISRYGPVGLAVLGAALFVILRPAVADLQAADARAAAASRGVGLSYWLSWYAGTAPGDYSILTPKLTAMLGVTSMAALSVVAIALLARPLLAGTARPRCAAYLVVVSALCNLWSGRVPFSLGVACSLAALLALRQRRVWLGGAVNGVAALFSPLAPAFLLLGLTGVAITRPARRGELARFALVSAAGLAVPAIAFGLPGHMPFAATTLGWTVGILLAALCLPLPRQVRVSLVAGVLVALGLFFMPNGVGANISRFAYLAVPPLVVSLSSARARLIMLALVPALAYSGYNVVSDQIAAAHPAAHQSYYAGLRAEVRTLPGLRNHRIEVVDTQTHRAAAALVPEAYLARGWEDQADTSTNPIFYDTAPLTAASYRQWLDGSAVAWIAVPVHPSQPNLAEARLVTAGLPYLHEIWQDEHWELYAVAHPQPIVSAPARLLSADETTLLVEVPVATTVTFRVHPSRYLRLAPIDQGADARPGEPTSICVTTVDQTAVQARVSVPGRYELGAPFSVSKMLGDNC